MALLPGLSSLLSGLKVKHEDPSKIQAPVLTPAKPPSPSAFFAPVAPQSPGIRLVTNPNQGPAKPPVSSPLATNFKLPLRNVSVPAQQGGGEVVAAPAQTQSGIPRWDPKKYNKGTIEERIAAWRADVDKAVDNARKALRARGVANRKDMDRLGPIYENQKALNAEDHKNWDAFIQSTFWARQKFTGNENEQQLVTLDDIKREFPFESWARVPDSTLNAIRTAYETAVKTDTDLRQSFDADWANADDGVYKQIDGFTKELGAYREWEKNYTGAQSSNSIAEQNYKTDVENYKRLGQEWQTYADNEAQWQAQKKQLDADIAAGKFRVQNAWKAILSGKLTPAQQEELMAQLEAGEYNPNIGVPQLPPQPVPPSEPMPKEPPVPPALVELPPLSIDPSVASALGIPAQHAGGTPTAIAAADTTLPKPTTVTPPPAATAASYAAPSSSSTGTAPPTSSTGASGSTTPPWSPDHVPTLAEAQAYVYPKTTPAAGATPVAGTPAPAPASSAPAAGTAEAPIAASEAPAGTGTAAPSETASTGAETPPAEETPPPANNGSESTGTGGNDKPKGTVQNQVGAGVNTDPQGTTNQTLAQAQSSSPSAPPQTTPGALSALTSGSAIETDNTGQETGQTTGQAGQDKDTEDKTKPQATPAILAPFQKQQDVEKTPEQQNAWA